MSLAHDIYDPPPAPIPWAPPEPEPLHWTAGDLVVLIAFSFLVLTASVWAGRFEPTLAPLIVTGGTLVIIESWFTALGFLHRHRHPLSSGFRDRWKIFLAALLPWVVGLGLAAGLMLALFSLSDRWG